MWERAKRRLLESASITNGQFRARYIDKIVLSIIAFEERRPPLRVNRGNEMGLLSSAARVLVVLLTATSAALAI